MPIKTININSFDLSSIFWKKIFDNSFLKIKPMQSNFFEKIDSLDKLSDALILSSRYEGLPNSELRDMSNKSFRKKTLKLF